MNHSFRQVLPFLFAMLFCLPISSQATSCLSNGIWTWPDNSLAANGRIIITGYARDRDMIRDFAFQHPRLVSGTEEIPLLIEVVYESRFELTQAVLIPSQLLQSGREYRLEVDSMQWLYGLDTTRFPNDSNEFRWEVTEQFDVTLPQWRQGPLAIGAYADIWGGMRLLLEYAVEDVQQCAIEVELSQTEGSNRTQKFIVASRYSEWNPDRMKDTLDIGYGACLGEFRIEEGIGYRARFTAIDASGNRTEHPQSCVLRYEKPQSSRTVGLQTQFPFSQEGCIEQIIRREEKEEAKIRVD